MPIGYPSGSTAGESSGGRRHPPDGSSIGSVASSKSKGTSSGPRAREGRIWGRGAEGSGMSVASSRSGSEWSK